MHLFILMDYLKLIFTYIFKLIKLFYSTIMNVTKILYIASIYNTEYKTNGRKRLVFSAFQKFHTLILKGLVENDCEVKVYSSVIFNNDCIVRAKKECFEKETFNYLGYINIPIIKNITVFMTCFFKTFFALFRHRVDHIIVDPLNISMAMGALLAAKLSRKEVTALITDLPGLMVNQNNSLLHRTIASINKSLVIRFDKYVLLTEQMNHIVNKKNHPYIVMEGLVDIDMKNFICCDKKENTRNIIYAGGLHERYGIKTLIDSFMRIDNSDLRLKLYGNGPMIKVIQSYEKSDPRIKYEGIVSNDVVVKEEMKAVLLVNPRPTTESFTKYSFPSKNMEYMVSGTALITTNLPGMPEEYKKYVYLFDDESVDGFTQTLKMIFSKEDSELKARGELAKEFVLENKNNVIQTNRILSLIKESKS